VISRRNCDVCRLDRRISPEELMISSLVLLKEVNYAQAEEKVKKD